MMSYIPGTYYIPTRLDLRPYCFGFMQLTDAPCTISVHIKCNNCRGKGKIVVRNLAECNVTVDVTHSHNPFRDGRENRGVVEEETIFC